MKKIFILIILILIIIIVLLSKKNIVKTSTEDYISKLLNNMTLEEKIAQMIIIEYPSNKINNKLNKILKDIKPGGFIITKSNITTYSETKKYIQYLKNNSNIPLIISMDEEGGTVQRLQYLKDIKPLYIPSMYYLGKTNNTQLAYNIGKIIAQQLRTLGINVTYAPVCDIYSNINNTVIGKRSFGSSPTLVSKMCISVKNGLIDNKVIPVIKHFPGHGDTNVDSHVELPIINKTYQELENNELIPFIDNINKGTQIIMIGHLALPKITGNNIPSTLSEEIITNILKNKLGYDGLIITDSLKMKALTDNYTEEEIYTMSINAGVDLLLMPNDIENAIKYIKKNISEERINKSVKKILQFKYTYLNEDNSLDKSYLNNSNQQYYINQIR